MSSQLNGDAETAGVAAEALMEMTSSDLVTNKQVLAMVDRALGKNRETSPTPAQVDRRNLADVSDNSSSFKRSLVNELRIDNEELRFLQQSDWNQDQQRYFEEMTSIQVNYKICQATEAAEYASYKAGNEFLRQTGPTFSAQTGIPYFYVASHPEYSFHNQLEMARLEKLFDLARQRFINASR